MDRFSQRKSHNSPFLYGGLAYNIASAIQSNANLERDTGMAITPKYIVTTRQKYFYCYSL